MTSDKRPQDGAEGLSGEAQALLRKASRPAPPTPAERAMMAAMAARIAAIPAPIPGRSVWTKLAGAGGWKGIGVAGFVLAVGGSAFFGVRSQSEPAKGDEDVAAFAASSPLPLEHAHPLPAERAQPEHAPPERARPEHAPPERAPALAMNRRATPRAVASAPPHIAERNVSPSKQAVSDLPKASPTCPSGQASSGDRAAEAPILAAAARALSSDPALTLVCVQQLSQIGGPFQLGDEQAFLAFEASRRLGRDAEARRHAQSLLRTSPGSAYAARVRAFLGEDAPPR